MVLYCEQPGYGTDVNVDGFDNSNRPHELLAMSGQRWAPMPRGWSVQRRGAARCGGGECADLGLGCGHGMCCFAVAGAGRDKGCRTATCSRFNERRRWVPTVWASPCSGLRVRAPATASMLVSDSGAEQSVKRRRWALTLWGGYSGLRTRTCYVLLRCHGRRAGRGVLNSHCDERRRWALGADAAGGSMQWLEGTHCGDGPDNFLRDSRFRLPVLWVPLLTSKRDRTIRTILCMIGMSDPAPLCAFYAAAKAVPASSSTGSAASPVHNDWLVNGTFACGMEICEVKKPKSRKSHKSIWEHSERWEKDPKKTHKKGQGPKANALLVRDMDATNHLVVARFAVPPTNLTNANSSKVEQYNQAMLMPDRDRDLEEEPETHREMSSRLDQRPTVDEES
ncbi:hypothetical protein B0H14DRAFT_2561669 [Mycena olivaceomarginata]|nr:hypothetical protein B0H14DRAFT_2561669 [Mycena olivaceomarginata]